MTEKPNVWTDDRLEGLKKLWSEGLSISQIGEALGVKIPLPEKRIEWACLNVHHQSVVQGLKGQKLWCLRCPSHCPLRLELRQLEWSRNKCCWPTGDPKKNGFLFCSGSIVPGKPIV